MSATSISAYLGYAIGDTLTMSRTYSNELSTYTAVTHNPSLIVPAITTDQQIHFNDVTTASVIFIETTQPVSIKLDSTSNTPILINQLCYITTTATALYVSNGNIVDATLRIMIIGV